VLVSIALELGEGEVGAYPRESWAQAPAADTDPDQLPAYHSEKRIAVYLVNDTAFDLNGQLRLVFRNSAGEELSSETSPLSAQANTNSPAAVVQLSELGVRSLRDLYVSAEFMPDDTSRADIDGLQAAIAAKVREFLSPAFEHFNRVDFTHGLKTDAILVEPKYFDWPEGVTINGLSRPNW
jgi:hypothetical protein